jgi:hypothetical protein
MWFERWPFAYHQGLDRLTRDELIQYKNHLQNQVDQIRERLAGNEALLEAGRSGFWSAAGKAVGGAALFVLPLALSPFDFGLTTVLLNAGSGALSLDGLIQVGERKDRNRRLADRIAWARTNLARIDKETGRIEAHLAEIDGR